MACITPLETAASVRIIVDIFPFPSVNITFPSLKEAIKIPPCTVGIENFPLLSFIV